MAKRKQQPLVSHRNDCRDSISRAAKPSPQTPRVVKARLNPLSTTSLPTPQESVTAQDGMTPLRSFVTTFSRFPPAAQNGSGTQRGKRKLPMDDDQGGRPREKRKRSQPKKWNVQSKVPGPPSDNVPNGNPRDNGPGMCAYPLQFAKLPTPPPSEPIKHMKTKAKPRALFGSSSIVAPRNQRIPNVASAAVFRRSEQHKSVHPPPTNNHILGPLFSIPSSKSRLQTSNNPYVLSGNIRPYLALAATKETGTGILRTHSPLQLEPGSNQTREICRVGKPGLSCSGIRDRARDGCEGLAIDVAQTCDVGQTSGLPTRHSANSEGQLTPSGRLNELGSRVSKSRRHQPPQKQASKQTVRVLTQGEPNHSARLLTNRTDIPIAKFNHRDYRPLKPDVITFGPKTYLGKGYLADLLKVASGDIPRFPKRKKHTTQVYFSIRMDFTDFLSSLRQVFDGLFALVTGKPTRDYEAILRGWKRTARLACKMTSWFVLESEGVDRGALSGCIEDSVLGILKGLDAEDLLVVRPDFLYLCWFCVEVIIRAGGLPSTCARNGFKRDSFGVATRFLVSYLVDHGFRKPYQSIHEDMDDTSLQGSVVQTWICLIHLFTTLNRPNGAERRTESFWDELRLCLPPEFKTSPRANEKLWEMIFGLHIFSQFSLLGIATAHPCIGPSWTFVAQIIRQSPIMPTLGSGPTTRVKEKDEYTAVILSRCEYLLDDFGWSIVGSLPVLTAFLEIFRARRYACLFQEDSQFPPVRVSNYKGISTQIKPDPDTVFTRVLSIVRRLHDTGTSSRPEITILGSLLTPSLALKIRHPGIEAPDERASVYHSFYSTTLAIGMQPELASKLITRLRSNMVTFEPVGDVSIHHLIIDGLKAIGRLVITQGGNIQAYSTWLAVVVKSTASEYEQMKARTRRIPCRKSEQMQKLVEVARSLYQLASSLVDTYADLEKYPDFHMLHAFTPLHQLSARNISLYRDRHFKSASFEYFRKLLLLVSRAETREMVGEHQHQGNSSNTLHGRTFATEGQLVKPVIMPCFHVCQARTKDLCSHLDVSKGLNAWSRHAGELKWWIDFSVGLLKILVTHNLIKDSMHIFAPASWGIKNEWLQVYVHLISYGEISRNNLPTKNLMDRELLKLLMKSLANFHVTNEPNYWCDIIDIQVAHGHPLFEGTNSITAEIAHLWPLRFFTVFLYNIDYHLFMETPDERVKSGVDLCLLFLYAVKRNVQFLRSNHHPSTAQYIARCNKIVALFYKYPETLKNGDRLRSFLRD